MSRAARDLAALLNTLPDSENAEPSEGEVFTCVPVPDLPCHRIGRDGAGQVALLIGLDQRYSSGPYAPVQLENLSVNHAARCTVSTTGAPAETALFSVIRCTAEDADLRTLFLEVMAAFVRTLPRPVPAVEAVAAVDGVIRLFRDLGRPSRSTAQGLW